MCVLIEGFDSTECCIIVKSSLSEYISTAWNYTVVPYLEHGGEGGVGDLAHVLLLVYLLDIAKFYYVKNKAFLTNM